MASFTRFIMGANVGTHLIDGHSEYCSTDNGVPGANVGTHLIDGHEGSSDATVDDLQAPTSAPI